MTFKSKIKNFVAVTLLSGFGTMVAVAAQENIDVNDRADGSRYVEGNPYWVDAQVIENLRPKQ